MGETRDAGNHGEEEKYYEQKMADTSIGAFFDSLKEFINCAVGSYNRVNEETVGRGVGCENLFR